jgi:VanZ family protein
MALIMGMIFYLSHQPGDFAPLPQFPGLDKAAHAIAYGILAGTFVYGLHPFANDSNRFFLAIMIVMFCLIFGITDEFHQSFIPGRNVSGWDIAADVFGGLLVAVLWYKSVTIKTNIEL